MGSRGPLPKPNARRRNKREVKGRVRSSRPVMPSSLPAEAKKEWRRVVPILEEMGTLTSVDRGALIRYCTAWAEWVELDELIAKTGKLVQGRDGNLVRNPAWLLRRDAADTLNTLGTQLHLTPASRLRGNIQHERDVEEAVPPGVADIEAFRQRAAQ